MGPIKLQDLLPHYYNNFKFQKGAKDARCCAWDCAVFFEKHRLNSNGLLPDIWQHNPADGN
jgi:hypothetical protein